MVNDSSRSTDRYRQGEAPLDWQVPLCRPSFREDELEALVEAYKSGWLTIGPRTAELEAAFCDYTGVEHAVAVSSCSAGLHLACLAAGFGPGDNVIVPSLTFTSTVSAIAHVGAHPRFVDIIDLTEPWPSVDAVADAIDEHTAGIVTMAYGGHLGETPQLAELARERGLVLIEDVAHAAGSRKGGLHAGTFGLAGVFSFSASKNLGVGEGGMLVTDDSEVAKRVLDARWHGLSSSTWKRHHESVSKYELGGFGFNYRFDDPRAALVNARLRHLNRDNRRREEIDSIYREAFAGSELIEATAPTPAGEPASYCMFTAVLAEIVDRDEFRRSLAARGVQTSVHYPPVHTSEAYAHAGLCLPTTEAYACRSVTLPLFAEMEGWQQELVLEAVADSLRDLRPAPVAA